MSMKFVLMIAMLLTGFTATAQTSNEVNNFGDKFTWTILQGTQVTTQRLRVTYQALNAKTTGVALSLGRSIPSGAVIKQVYYVVQTTFADSGTAGDADTSTISIGANTNVDLKAAIAISNGANPWDAGIAAGIPINTAATMVKLTAARNIKVVWTAGTGNATALTAGIMDIFVDYVFPQP
jgi:hypothetical protein